MRWTWAAATLLVLPWVAAAAADTQVHYVMGTYLRVTAHDPGDAAAGMADCFRDARRLDRVFSRWMADSELSRLNAAAPGARAIGPDMAQLLARSLALAHATGGAFDVAAGPLTALWRRPDLPRPEEVDAARAAAGRGAVSLRGDRVTLATGARLDFDGIAKGWAVDACVARLRAAGVSAALVSFGESSLAAIGAPPGASHWRLAVRGTDPATIVGWLGVRDAGVSVSAVYGDAPSASRRVSHIVDPRTGRLVEDEAVAVAVAPVATDAEAWTKAVLVRGRGGVSLARAGGARAAIRVAPDRIDADVASDVTWTALPAPQLVAAREEPLR